MTTNQDLIQTLHNAAEALSREGFHNYAKDVNEAIAALSSQPAPVAAESWQEWIDQNAETEPLLLNDWYVPVTKLKERLATLSPPPQSGAPVRCGNVLADALHEMLPYLTNEQAEIVEDAERVIRQECDTPAQSGDAADEAKFEELLSAALHEAYCAGMDFDRGGQIDQRDDCAEALRSFFKRAAKGGEGMVSVPRDALEFWLNYLEKCTTSIGGGRAGRNTARKHWHSLQSALATKHP